MKSNSMKRCVNVLLTFIFALGLFLVVGLENKVSAASVTLKDPVVSGDTTTWDCIWFGSYPQTEILPGNSTYTSLQNASGWDANEELTLNGVKYRRIKKSHATFSSNSGTTGYYNWSDSTTWHYFRYEPIKWRALEAGGNMFLMADKAIDTKSHGSATLWVTSDIRGFLNSTSTGRNSFLGSAFTAEQQSSILTTAVENQYLGATYNINTDDKVYLLWTFELDFSIGNNDAANRYGFVSNATRICQPTDYAKAMGVSHGTGNCSWWTRMPAYTLNGDYIGARYVSSDGRAGLHCDSTRARGIRPVLHMDSSKTNLYSYAGTVSSNGTVNEQSIPMSDSSGNIGNAGNRFTSGNKEDNKSVILERARVKSVTLAGSRALKVKIKRDKKASGYQIQYSTNKKFKKNKTKTVNLKKNKKTTKVLKKLKKGKKYYIRVRSFQKVKSGNSVIKVYGSWSKTVKSKKIK